MVSEIRIYVEGGGPGIHTQLLIREGFSKFLSDLKLKAIKNGIEFGITACGPRGNAKKDFFIALENNPEAFNVLLVDSEGPVNNLPWEHLKTEKWDCFTKNINENCHLMVQVVESWLIADINALKDFYGDGFREEKIPQETNIEEITKETVDIQLRAAIRNTVKRKYKKIHHCSKILALLDSTLVRSKAPHCDRLFTTLTEKMEAAS